MGYEIAGAVVINIILLVLLITMVVGIVYYRNESVKCSNKQSDYCYTIHCPVDDAKTGPRFGFAMRKGNKGEKEGYYCSNNPDVLVDEKGRAIN